MADEKDQLDLESILGEPVEVEIKDDTKPVVTSPSPEETIESLKAQIAEQNKNLAAQRERAEKAETATQNATQTATTATQSAWQMKETAIDTAINASKSDLDSIKKQLKVARSGGDIDAEIDLEEKLADAKYQLNASLWEKKNLDAAKADNERRAKIEAAQPRQQNGFSAKSQEWISEHPRFNTDEEYQAQVFASHNVAIKKGYQPDSDAYFEFINTRLAKVAPEDSDDVAPARQSQVVSTAAPPSRSAIGGKAINGRTVKLTADEIEAAEMSGMTPAEYAAEKIKIEEEKRGR